MSSYPYLSNLSWENGVPVLYISQNAKINIDLQNYVEDEDGNTVTITFNSTSLPSGLTYENGIISGTTTDNNSGNLNITLTDSTGLTNIQAITIKPVSSSLIETDDLSLTYVLGAVDTSFTKATTSNTKTFFEFNSYDGGFSKIYVNKGIVTVNDYYNDGNLKSDSLDSFTMTDSIGSDDILDTVTSTWATENFTYGTANAVTSINGVSTPGLYKVDVTTKVKTAGTVEKSDDWWKSGYTYNNQQITTLSTLQTMLTTENINVWMESDIQVRLLPNGKVVSCIKDGSVYSSSNDSYEYNFSPTTEVVGAWTNSNGYLKVILTTGEVTAFKISKGGVMQTQLPASGYSEIMTWYYSDNLNVSDFNKIYQNIIQGKTSNNDTTTDDNSSNDNTTITHPDMKFAVMDDSNNIIKITTNNSSEFEIDTNGNIIINGFGGNDKITGTNDNDYIDGGVGADLMNGGKGDDTYIVDNKKDMVKEAAKQGDDTIIFSDGIEEISLGKLPNVENLIFTGSDYAGLMGNKLDNTLIGGSGENDLFGGLGNDTLTGGADKDWFWFNTKLGSANVDTITDFVSGEDIIVLTPKLFKKLAKNFTEDNFITGNSAIDNDDYVIFNDENNTLYYDADGSGTKASAQEICIVGTNTTITFSDIEITNP